MLTLGLLPLHTVVLGPALVTRQLGNTEHIHIVVAKPEYQMDLVSHAIACDNC
jgi:hypothetical protein